MIPFADSEELATISGATLIESCLRFTAWVQVATNRPSWITVAFTVAALPQTLTRSAASTNSGSFHAWLIIWAS